MSAQWPNVLNWLTTTVPTLAGWSAVTVFDGPPVTGDNPFVYFTVGYVSGDQAGSYTQAQDPSGFQLQETGEVKCELVINNGDGSVPAARAQGFALLDAIEAAIRADRRLAGTLPPQSDVTTAVDVLSVENAAGAAEAFVFTVHYFTVTP